MKNPLTLAGIEPATFRFVAQHLTHCATTVPEWDRVSVCYLHQQSQLQETTLLENLDREAPQYMVESS